MLNASPLQAIDSHLAGPALAAGCGPALAQVLIARRAAEAMARRLGPDDVRLRLARAGAEALAAALLADLAGPYGIVQESPAGNRAALGGDAASWLGLYLRAQGDFADLIELKERLADELLPAGG